MDSDEVRKRKEYAERKVKERHAALRKEAEEKRKHVVEHRERVQSQLKREQVLLQKRMQQLNEDEERKKTTLAKQHEATSRIAAITKSPKSFAFGSSTPRTLAYLDNLPKSEQLYDKKLRPIEGSATPVATSPTAKSARHLLNPPRAPPAAHKPAPTMTSMTSSMYVTSSAPPTRHAKTSIKPALTATPAGTKRISSAMTQSVYTPTSRPATSSRLSMNTRQIRGSTPTSARSVAPTPSTPSTPASRPQRNVQKPPAPRRNTLFKPEVQKKTAEVVPVVEASVPAKEASIPVAPEAPAASEEVQEKHEVSPIEEINEETPREVEEVELKDQKVEDQKVEDQKIEEPVEEVPEALEAIEKVLEAVEATEAVEAAEKASEALEASEASEDPEDQKVQEDQEESEESKEIVIPVAEPVESAEPETPETPKAATPEPQASESTESHLDHQEHPDPPKEDLISLEAHETSGSNAGSSVNTSLAEELLEVQPAKPEVMELQYPVPAAVNDLVDVFGNDFINEQHPPAHRIVDFDEDADSGKASPTSSETSSTTDEVTPRSVIEEVKVAAPRVLPLVRSAEDIAKKEKEAREAEDRKNRLAAILAKSRGMASPVTNTLPPQVSSIDSTPTPTAAAPPTPSPIPTMEASDLPPPPTPSSSEEQPEKNEPAAASDVLSRIAASTNLPTLQKLLQRKQGSNPSLQTSESTGGEIY